MGVVLVTSGVSRPTNAVVSYIILTLKCIRIVLKTNMIMKIYLPHFFKEYINCNRYHNVKLIVILYIEFKNACLGTLDSIVLKNVLIHTTERNVNKCVNAAMRHVMRLQVVEISQHSQLS